MGVLKVVGVVAAGLGLLWLFKTPFPDRGREALLKSGITPPVTPAPLAAVRDTCASVDHSAIGRLPSSAMFRVVSRRDEAVFFEISEVLWQRFSFVQKEGLVAMVLCRELNTIRAMAFVASGQTRKRLATWSPELRLQLVD